MTHPMRQHLLFGIAFVAFSSCGGSGFVRDNYDGGKRDGDIFTPVASGQVIIGSDAGGANGPGSTASAAFWRESGDCKQTVIGPCQTLCPGAPSAYQSAGEIQVTGGIKTVTLDPNEMGIYNVYTDNTSPLWMSATMLTVTAAGTPQVPSFNGKVGTPDSVTVTSPSGASIDVPRTKPLAFAWTGGGTGEVKVTIVAGTAALSCHFPSAVHAASVPASALNLLSAGLGSIAVTVEVSTQVTAGDYDVKISSVTDALGPTGAFANFSANLQ
jgi:hypothetical protein